MAQALITINTNPGSEIDFTLPAVLNLSNQDSGGEVSYLWSIEDQPPGPTDSLSATNIKSPILGLNKEGSYRIKLIVNQGLPTEVENEVIAAAPQVRSNDRVPAAGEEVQVDPTKGWALAAAQWFRRADLLGSEGASFVGAAGQSLATNDIVRISGVTAMLTGLPGAFNAPTVLKALATTAGNQAGFLGIVDARVDGNSSALTGQLVKVRILGFIDRLLTGAFTAGTTIYLSDTGTIASSAGTVSRRLGNVVTGSGTQFRIAFNGTLEA